MNSKLDFLVIGAQKCATSWLYYCLKEHPELHLPSKKREVEYLGGDLFQARGDEWYFSLLGGADTGQKVGDVSIEYLFDCRSPKVVHKFSPGVRLVVSLRNPIDRIISAYYWNLRKGLIAKLPLEEGIQAAMENFADCEKNVRGNPYSDLINRGFYDIQIERYMEYFDKEQILFLLFEDLKINSLNVLRILYDFIGVESNFKPPSLNAKPKKNTYLPLFIFIERYMGNFFAFGKIMDIINHSAHRFGIGVRKPALSGELKFKLNELFAPHVEKLYQILKSFPNKNRPFDIDKSNTWINTWEKQK